MLTPGTKRVPNAATLVDIIRSFNMGLYSLHICLANNIASARSPAELAKNLHRYDKYIIKIVADYCGLEDQKISLNRITSELNISHARVTPCLIRYCSDFYSYLSTVFLMSPHSATKLAVLENTSTLKKLAYCNQQLADQVAEPPAKWRLPDDHWLNAPRKIRRCVAKIFLGYDHAQYEHISGQIRCLIALKHYARAKEVASTALQQRSFLVLRKKFGGGT